MIGKVNSQRDTINQPDIVKGGDNQVYISQDFLTETSCVMGIKEATRQLSSLKIEGRGLTWIVREEKAAKKKAA